MKVRVKEVNPLKQGLKLYIVIVDYENKKKVKEVNPLKQGLKHFNFSLKNSSLIVKEVNPIKQGFKLMTKLYNVTFNIF